MNKRTLTICLILASALIAGPACRSVRKVEMEQAVTASDEALFKMGEDALKKDDEKARIYFRQVIDSYPKSIFAQRAKLAIADSYFKKNDEVNMALAEAEYREFIKMYPLSPSVSYAQFQIALTFYKGVLKPERDPTKTIKALNEFKAVLTNYPLSEEAKKVQDKIKECEERLAVHNLSIALHYHRVYALKASATRFQEILTQYPNFSKMEVVYFYLADSYFLWGKLDQAAPYFTKLITDYPKSSYVKKAQAKLKEIEKLKAIEAKKNPEKK